MGCMGTKKRLGQRRGEGGIYRIGGGPEDKIWDLESLSHTFCIISNITFLTLFNRQHIGLHVEQISPAAVLFHSCVRPNGERFDCS